jgi:hypothetical protein
MRSMLLTKLFLFQTIRYFVIGGGAFLLLNKWAKLRFQKHRIQETPFTKKQISTEIKYSLITILIFSVFFSIQTLFNSLVTILKVLVKATEIVFYYK